MSTKYYMLCMALLLTRFLMAFFLAAYVWKMYKKAQTLDTAGCILMSMLAGGTAAQTFFITKRAIEDRNMCVPFSSD